MRCSLKKAVLSSLAVLFGAPASGVADLITFENLSISILVDAGPQTEGAFTYEAIDGAWELQTTWGNPGSSLATFFNSNTSDDFPFVGQKFEITRTGGGFFTFESVDFATRSSSSSDDVVLTGFLGGTPTNTLALTSSTPLPTAFQTVASGFTGPIDLLRVELTFHCCNGLFLDNFNLTILQPGCPDGSCTPPENSTTCPDDCFCSNGSCDVDENACTCLEDCGTPPLHEADCADGVDNDCDGLTDSADSDCQDCGGSENFESGAFGTLPWSHSGNANWLITSAERHSGIYSARAGTIGHFQSSSLAVTLECENGTISFWRKVSSESNYDYLRFYVDGVLQQSWSGAQNWAQESFPVTAGLRTFRWTYSKDGSVVVGADTAWLDDITFPRACPCDPSCTSDAQCDDGVFCNGTEHCVDGCCRASDSVDCPDVECGDICNEEQRTCNAPKGTPCTDDGNPCRADVCDGNGSCGQLSPDGTPCGDPSDTDCDSPDTCDSEGHCLPNLEPAGVVCRGAAGPCDVQEACDGASRDCPPDDFAPEGTPCPDNLFCNGAESCSGAICQPGAVPCLPGECCDERIEECSAAGQCTTDVDCEDRLFCTGLEACVGGCCVAGAPPCAECCNEVADACDAKPCAIVRMNPPVAEIDRRLGGTTATFEVIIESMCLLTQVDAVDLLIGSNDGMRITKCSINPAAGFRFTDCILSVGFYVSDAFMSGFIPPVPLSPPVLMGTITVDATGLAPGEYKLLVSSEYDGFSAAYYLASQENLCGEATVVVSGGCRTDADCDDGSICTDDRCDLATGCMHVNNTVPCDDGDACTTNDTCDEGVCVGGPPLECIHDPAFPECWDVFCDPATGCVFAPNIEPCDNGDPCIVGETCQLGVCTGGAPPDCWRGECMFTVCNSAGEEGNCDIKGSEPEGTRCRVGDQCTPDAHCTGPMIGQVCIPDPFPADGSPCDDGDTCTVDETCQDGVCGGGAPVDCASSGDQCSIASCDPDGSEGNCDILSPVADGAPCGDLSDTACDNPDTCDGAGTCRGNLEPSGTPCPNNFFCDGDETCQAGACTAGRPPCPADGLFCNGHESCNEDGDRCEHSGDPCATGQCCDEGNDQCVTGAICTNHGDCDDGLFCNGAELCIEGCCRSGAPPCAGECCEETGVCATCDVFTVGGAAYTDCRNVLSSGLLGVTFDLGCDNAFSGEAVTAGQAGLWRIDNVPASTCTVTPRKPGWECCFVPLQATCPPGTCSRRAQIVIDVDHEAENQSIQFLCSYVCTPGDMSCDGFPSIIGDVPCFVDCVYRGNCGCCQATPCGCVPPGDFNCDGFMSIVGDVPGFVDCVYFEECPADCCPQDGSTAVAAGTSGFTIGGAVYEDMENPLLSGIEDLPVELMETDGAVIARTLTGALGLWRVDNVVEGKYTVVFGSGTSRVPRGTHLRGITVNADNEAANQSIQLHNPAYELRRSKPYPGRHSESGR